MIFSENGPRNRIRTLPKLTVSVSLVQRFGKKNLAQQNVKISSIFLKFKKIKSASSRGQREKCAQRFCHPEGV